MLTVSRWVAGGVVAALVGMSALPAIAGEPIPGVDVNLGKNPGGALGTVGHSGASGQIDLNLSLGKGVYELTLSCKSGCPPARLAGLSLNGMHIPRSTSLRIDTTASPSGKVHLTGRVEVDPGGTKAAGIKITMTEVLVTSIARSGDDGADHGDHGGAGGAGGAGGKP